MKQLVLSVLFFCLLVPTGAHAAIAAPWNATSTDIGFISPNRINGNNPFVKGNYFIASSTSIASTFPYASTTSFTASGTGYFGTTSIASSTPTSPLSVEGNINQHGAYMHLGTTYSSATCLGVVSTCLEVVGNDNTINGVQLGVGNTNAGTSAYSGLFLNNNLADNTYTHYSFIGLNSSTYLDTTFGTGLAIPNQLAISNTDGPITTAAVNATGYINFLTSGAASTNERMRITAAGNVGIGTTTPARKLDVAGTGNTTSQVLLEDTSAGANMHYQALQSVNGKFNINSANDSLATTTVATFATSSVPFLGVGTTTQMTANSIATFTTGASATTTVNFANIGDTSSKTCFNINASDGTAGSFYMNAAHALVAEANYCR